MGTGIALRLVVDGDPGEVRRERLGRHTPARRASPTRRCRASKPFTHIIALRLDEPPSTFPRGQ